MQVMPNASDILSADSSVAETKFLPDVIPVISTDTLFRKSLEQGKQLEASRNAFNRCQLFKTSCTVQ